MTRWNLHRFELCVIVLLQQDGECVQVKETILYRLLEPSSTA